MNHRVRFTPEAEEDLLRLFDHLARRDLPSAKRARTAIRRALKMLQRFPFSCRKAESVDQPLDPRLRELLIPFGASGYVALFEIEDDSTVTILALRHQREDDYL